MHGPLEPRFVGNVRDLGAAHVPVAQAGVGQLDSGDATRADHLEGVVDAHAALIGYEPMGLEEPERTSLKLERDPGQVRVLGALHVSLPAAHQLYTAPHTPEGHVQIVDQRLEDGMDTHVGPHRLSGAVAAGLHRHHVPQRTATHVLLQQGVMCLESQRVAWYKDHARGIGS